MQLFYEEIYMFREEVIFGEKNNFKCRLHYFASARRVLFDLILHGEIAW